MLMDGKIVYFLLYDIGAFLDLNNIKKTGKTINKKLNVEQIEIKRDMSKYAKPPRYLCFKVEEKEILTNKGVVNLKIILKVFSVGIVSYKISMDFRDEQLETLFSYYSLTIKEGEADIPLERYIDGIHKTILHFFKNAFKETMIRPYGVEERTKIQTIFCIKGMGNKELRKTDMKTIAALLSNEPDSARLSEETIADKTQYRHSYHADDIVVIDQDSALIIEPSGQYEDILLTIEFANLQRLELKTYDEYFDRAVTKTYGDIQKFFSKINLFKSPIKIIRELSETKIDFIRVTDYILDITKFFNDPHLAKVYTVASKCFHLSKWQDVINQKMDILSSLYLMLNQETTNRRLLTLDFLVVILFVVETIMIFLSMY